MTGNTFGKIFRVTTWGESHGHGLGCVVDRVPPNIELNEKFIQELLDKESRVNQSLQHKEKKMTRLKFYQVYFKEKQLEHQFH